MDLAKAVQESITRHMWYLSEELVVLCLCDEDTVQSSKEEIVQELLKYNRPDKFEPQKPQFKEKALNKDAKLSDFVGERWVEIISVLILLCS